VAQAVELDHLLGVAGAVLRTVVITSTPLARCPLMQARARCYRRSDGCLHLYGARAARTFPEALDPDLPGLLSALRWPGPGDPGMR